MSRSKKKKTPARLTTRERLAIVEEAIRLIRDPKNWVARSWKREVGTDRHDEPVYAYCLDGAVNQATVNVLGLDRAVRLGAAEECSYEMDGYKVEGAHGGGEPTMCSRLSVRQLAFDVVRERYGYDLDQEKDDEWQLALNDDKLFGHRYVLQVLRKKAKELRAKVKELDERKATA